MDVHEYIPKLSKKPTLFRVNQSTIIQRGQEFKAMIDALLDEDAHSTIQELRTVPPVRHFFALWKRDKDAERRSSKVSVATTAPPLPEHIKIPALVPAANVAKPSPTIDHLNAFLHTPTSTPGPPKHTSRNSYAPLRSSGRPHTANPGETSFQSSRPHISRPLNTFNDDECLSDGPPASSRMAPHRPPLRMTRSSTAPNIDYVATRAQSGAVSDAESRPKEPLLLRTIKDNNGMHRAPARQVSTPELPRSNHLEWCPSRDLPSRDVDSRAPVTGAPPIPAFMPSQRHTSPPGGARRPTLRGEESTEGYKPLRSFPFDHPPDSPPITPGIAGFGVGRVVGRQLESLAVLDPEMYQSLYPRQASQSPPWNHTTPTSVDSGQVQPRARKTPPILDQGNRSARFFVDDPTNGMVDVAGGPPPHSPVIASAPMGMDTAHEEVGHFKRVAVSRQFQTTKPENPPAGKTTVKPLLDMSDHGHKYAHTSLSAMSVPGLLSPYASSRSSQGSPLPTTGGNNQRFRPRGSLGFVADRRLSLDSLLASDFELPYLSRNLSTPQFSQENKSAEHVYAALNALNTPSATVTPRGRGSYSSQETDSTSGVGLEDNLGMTSSGSSQYAPAWLPLSKTAGISPKSTPPRPPRSALRNSSRFSAGVIHRINESLNTDQHSELPPAEAHDFTDSYVATPQLQQAALDPPQPPYMGKSQRDSAMSTMSTLQYYQNIPDYHESHQATELDLSAASLPPTPFTATFDPVSRLSNYKNQPPNTGAVPIKAVHAQSETIVLFKISRYETTLADLRGKVARKFREAEGLDLNRFSLKYLPPRSDHGFISPLTGRTRTTSVTSTSDVSTLACLDNETDWQRALAGNYNHKLIIRIV
jgi:hypothetical protein